MFFAIYVAGVLALYSLVIRFAIARGTSYGGETLKAIGWLKVLTRKGHRWNELAEVREQAPYVGYRQAYMENRAAVYSLFGLVPIFFRFYQVEIAMNDIISVMTIGDSLKGKELDKHFPAHLAYGGRLGKGSPMGGEKLAGAGLF